MYVMYGNFGGGPVYWSEEDGWTDLVHGTKYTEEEKAKRRCMPGGRWVKYLS